jgi:glyoxylate carboligase
MAYLAGKQAFLRILQQEGVSVMFGNPGTTELPLMDGLAREPGIRYVLALQEAVAISMADAYAQASGGLGAVNVHVSPGLGNAMGMLDDAYKAGVAGRTLRHAGGRSDGGRHCEGSDRAHGPRNTRRAFDGMISR